MNALRLLQDFDWISMGCLAWLLICWIGYTRFSRRRAAATDCLTTIMHELRLAWMREVLHREQRVSDTSIIANLERNVSFMASTSILVLAGLVTALASTDKVHAVLSNLHLTMATSPEQLQFKLLVLSCIFVYAFFTFTWSLRQFGFCSVILGATPLIEPGSRPQQQLETYARHCGDAVDQASITYNYGLRAYYFAMSTLAWFIDPLLFVLAVALVVWVLYRREFRSGILKVLMRVQQDWQKEDTE